MVLGSLMVMKADAPYLQISLSVIIPVVGLAAAFSFFVLGMGIRAIRRQPTTGSEGMVGLIGVAKTPLTPNGKVLVQGELWDAICDSPQDAGDSIKIISLDGLTLHVQPAHNQGDA